MEDCTVIVDNELDSDKYFILIRTAAHDAHDYDTYTTTTLPLPILLGTSKAACFKRILTYNERFNNRGDAKN